MSARSARAGSSVGLTETETGDGSGELRTKETKEEELARSSWRDISSPGATGREVVALQQ